MPAEVVDLTHSDDEAAAPASPAPTSSGRHSWLSLFDPVRRFLTPAPAASASTVAPSPAATAHYLEHPHPHSRLSRVFMPVARRGRGGAARGRGRGGSRRGSAHTAAYHEALFGHDQGDYLDDFIPANAPALLRAFLDEAFDTYTPNNAQPTLSQQPKYSRKQSHPRKLIPGYRRDVAPPPQVDVDLSGGLSSSRLAPSEALCCSCSRPFLLNASALPELTPLEPDAMGRAQVLCCGHLVCSSCLYAARVRRRRLIGAWRPVRGRAARKVAYDDADFDPDAVESQAGPMRRSKGKRAKGKGKAKVEEEILPMSDEAVIVEEGWTRCPVEGCDGAGGDVAAEDGTGPVEMFV